MLTKLDPATMKKTRPQDNPYEVWRAGDWEWKVLKKYSKDDSDEFARAFCAVTSPHTYGLADLGDTYVRDYESVARLVAVNP
jgi:hypothetical protein